MGVTSALNEVRVVRYEDHHQADFERLNRAWIEKYFVTEPVDERQLTAPRAEIIEPGGAILIAERAGVAVGTVALMMKHGDDDEFELGKMAVAESERGNGIGNALMETAIAEAKQRDARAITLFSNTKLVPALRLYEKYGFKQIPLGPDNPYEQANVAMVLYL